MKNWLVLKKCVQKNMSRLYRGLLSVNNIFDL